MEARLGENNDSETDSDNSFSSTQWPDDDDEYEDEEDEYDSDGEKKQVRFKEGDLLEQWKSSQSLPDEAALPKADGPKTPGRTGMIPKNTPTHSVFPHLDNNERGVDVGSLPQNLPSPNQSDTGFAKTLNTNPSNPSLQNPTSRSQDNDDTESETDFGFVPLPVQSPSNQVEEWASSPLSSPNPGFSSHRDKGRPKQEYKNNTTVIGASAKNPKKKPLKNLPEYYKVAKDNMGWNPAHICIGLGKTIALLYFLYLFVCSLDLLSTGFRLIGGRTAGEFFSNSEILQNPVVGVMLGILTTVFVQSSSTSTSIIVGMVAAEFMTVPMAIPLIMGANIGTSITNTIVSFMQASDREQFERAFAGATILDMFNWITVIVLLTVEVATGYLYHLSGAILNGIMPDTQSGSNIETLSVLTDPFVNLIIQLDENVLACWTDPTCTSLRNASLIKEYCSNSVTFVQFSQTITNITEVIIQQSSTNHTILDPKKCKFLFAGTTMSDAAVGAIILTLSLIVLCACLIFIVKILSSVLQGQVATAIEKTLNAKIPYVPWLTGYLAILVGAVMTFLVQSSSVFTSAITPLIGLGVISLERSYPLTLGANIGTTTTALIASMAVDGASFRPSMQIALVHLLFNFTGILLFYPIPFMRFPIGMARFLGRKTAKYRWFAILYIVVMFVLVPLIFILLSLGGSIIVLVFCAVLAIFLLFIATTTIVQRKIPRILPPALQTWKFLPIWFRSLEPYDNLFTNASSCCSRKSLKEPAPKSFPTRTQTRAESQSLNIDNDEEMRFVDDDEV